MVFLEKFSFTSSFFLFLLKMQKNNVIEDKWFSSKLFYQIKIQASTNWSSHLKKHQTFDFFSNDRFFRQFSKTRSFPRF